MTLLLDEDDELYGYALLNVHKNKFITGAGESNRGMIEDSDLFQNAEDAREHAEKLLDNSGVDDLSHIRLVQVRLDNEEDEKLAEVTV